MNFYLRICQNKILYFSFKFLWLFLVSLNWLELLVQCWIVIVLSSRWKDLNLLSRSMILGIDLSRLSFIKLKFPSISNYSVFNHKWQWSFIKWFFCTNFNSYIFFLFYSVNIVNFIDCFSMVSQASFTRINSKMMC